VRGRTHEILAAGQAWWSLGFEATGPAGLLGSALRATAALVFAHDMPGGAELATGHSRSYAEWLAAGADADAAHARRCRSHAEPRASAFRGAARAERLIPDPAGAGAACRVRA